MRLDEVTALGMRIVDELTLNAGSAVVDGIENEY
jgi:hypothetical protein